MNQPASREDLCLIYAPRGRDAAVVTEVLAARGLDSHTCGDGAQLLAGLEAGAGFAILSEEALPGIDAGQLARWIGAQPHWSDLPFILFASRDAGSRSLAALRTLETLANLVLLERPVNAVTLGAAAASGLRARRRQYQARAQLNEIEATERDLRLALRAGRLGSWELNLATRKLSTSELCRQNFGHSKDHEMTYRDMIGAVHPQDRRYQHEAIETAIDKHTDFDIEYRTYWPDGSLHWIQVRGQAISDERGARLTGVCADTTERRTAEDALRASRAEVERMNDGLETRIRERTAELAQANDRLTREIGERERAQNAFLQAQKMEAMGQLTGGIAHDFNNLLHVVHMNLTMISQLSKDANIQKLVEPARRAVDRGTKLTGQLLTFARNQALSIRAVEVNGLLGNMGDLLKISIGDQIPVRMQLAEGELAARADPNQLEMAVLNLAINARDAMPRGGEISITTARAGGQAGTGRALITVADNGAGIAPEILGRVFDPFFTTKPSGKGTGLGLSQVYGFAKQCGGSVNIKSELGRGTQVEISLPLEAMKKEEPARAPAVERPPRGVSGHILVIEDNDDVRDVMVTGLQSLGYSVEGASGGRDGLRAIEARAPDLLITDYMMPDMNGAEVTAEVQARWPGLPVLIATGYADMRAAEKLIGVQNILHKPFDLTDLGGAVMAAFDRVTPGAGTKPPAARQSAARQPAASKSASSQLAR